MFKYLFKTYIIFFLLLIAVFSKAQKNIIINDSLGANSDKLNVKMGSQGMGKIWKFHFGDYGVVSSKLGWEVTSTKGNFFNTKTESKSTQKFSFLLAGKSSDTAKVNAARNIMVQSLNEIDILHNFTWGDNEVKLEAENFTAFITINSDTSEVWALIMSTKAGPDKIDSNQAFLTNGERKIILIPASSNKKGGDEHSLPALGFEFIENGQSIGALQYYGGGMMGMNKNIIWLHKDLTDKMKLILAAAMTAILQVRAVPG
jgi:hypothetical protein